MKSIGRFCFEDDQYLISSTSSYFTEGFARCNPPGVMPYDWGSREKVFCTLKQKLLVYLFRKAQTDLEMQKDALTKFYQNFEFFSKLRMWKMQLLDEDHLLIRCLIRILMWFWCDLRSPLTSVIRLNLCQANGVFCTWLHKALQTLFSVYVVNVRALIWNHECGPWSHSGSNTCCLTIVLLINNKQQQLALLFNFNLVVEDSRFVVHILTSQSWCTSLV